MYLFTYGSIITQNCSEQIHKHCYDESIFCRNPMLQHENKMLTKTLGFSHAYEQDCKYHGLAKYRRYGIATTPLGKAAKNLALYPTINRVVN